MTGTLAEPVRRCAGTLGDELRRTTGPEIAIDRLSVSLADLMVRSFEDSSLTAD